MFDHQSHLHSIRAWLSMRTNVALSQHPILVIHRIWVSHDSKITAIRWSIRHSCHMSTVRAFRSIVRNIRIPSRVHGGVHRDLAAHRTHLRPVRIRRVPILALAIHNFVFTNFVHKLATCLLQKASFISNIIAIDAANPRSVRFLLTTELCRFTRSNISGSEGTTLTNEGKYHDPRLEHPDGHFFFLRPDTVTSLIKQQSYHVWPTQSAPP